MTEQLDLYLWAISTMELFNTKEGLSGKYNPIQNI